ncbi:MAG: hypothetical protein WAX20_05580, partial [Enterococcus aquimarinus]
IGNTGLLSNSLSIKVFKIFYAFDIAIKHYHLFDYFFLFFVLRTFKEALPIKNTRLKELSHNLF